MSTGPTFADWAQGLNIGGQPLELEPFQRRLLDSLDAPAPGAVVELAARRRGRLESMSLVLAFAALDGQRVTIATSDPVARADLVDRARRHVERFGAVARIDVEPALAELARAAGRSFAA